MKPTRRGSDPPVHRPEKTPRFQIQLDKWPLSPGTPREASGVPCLNPRRGPLPVHQTPWSPERPLPPPVSLTSQSHHEKPPEVTCTSRGKPGFPASTRERPRETFFNTSRGQIPLPGLESNDALPLATRMETRLPWRPTRGSLTSPSYLVRNRSLGPPLENNPKTPPASRDEGLRLLHGLETNLAASQIGRASCRER